MRFEDLLKFVVTQRHNHNLRLLTRQSPYVIDVKVLSPEKEICIVCSSCYLRIRRANFIVAAILGVWHGLWSQKVVPPDAAL